jgi:hypothetical protein
MFAVAQGKLVTQFLGGPGLPSVTKQMFIASCLENNIIL